MVFGALGVFGYIGHPAWRVLEHSKLFPFVLSLIGVFIIFLGINYHRRQASIEKYILDNTPKHPEKTPVPKAS